MILVVLVGETTDGEELLGEGEIQRRGLRLRDREHGDGGGAKAGGGKKEKEHVTTNPQMPSPAVVVLAHNRPQSLSDCLMSLLSLEDAKDFSIYVSFDDPSVVASVKNKVHDVNRFASHFGGAAVADIWSTKGEEESSLLQIASHIKFALSRAFFERDHSHVILLEDDLVVAQDFLTLFRSTAWLLDADPTLFCVSAWNDNGFRAHVYNQTQLHRTGFFPGLGWMIKRSMWDELAPKWPRSATTGFDHWLRLDTISKYRDCIFPEIPRTKHHSKIGTNVQGSSLYDRYAFSSRAASKLPVGPTATFGRRGKLDPSSGFGNLRYLLHDNYESWVHSLIESATHVRSHDEILSASPTHSEVYVLPFERGQFRSIARHFDLFDVQPRSWYKGVIITTIPGKKHVTLLLVNSRGKMSKLLNKNERIEQNREAQIIRAKQGESCNSACRNLGLDCDEMQIEFLNSCEAMENIFDCDNGCGHQVGLELPCYVSAKSEATFKQCLITNEGTPNCYASNVNTERACACARPG